MIKKRLLCILFTVCMIIQLLPISMIAQGTGTSSDPIIVYRNPTLDYAGESFSITNVSDFYVRDNVLSAWEADILTNSTLDDNSEIGDLKYYVSTFKDNASISGNLLGFCAGYFFGWESVKGGNSSFKLSSAEKVYLYDNNGTLINDGNPIIVKVKGYVDVNWVISTENTVSGKVSLSDPENNSISIVSGAPTAQAEDYAESLTDKDAGIQYVFRGWDTDGDGDCDTTDEEYLSSAIDVTALKGALAADAVEGKTFTAVYEVQYNVIWNADIGDFGTDEDGNVIKKTTSLVFEGEKPVPPTSINIPTGYTHTGWDGLDDNTTVTGPVTFTATFDKNKYTVTWNAGKGMFGDQSSEKTTVVEYGATPVAPEEPTKEGYTFTGWNGLDENTVITADGSEYTATYTINSYTVKWLNEDGTEIEEDTAVFGSAIIDLIPETNPVKDGYTFLGWDGNSDGVADNLKDATVPSKDVEYKAVFSDAATWTVTFNYGYTDENGDDVVSTLLVVGGEKISDPGATRDGYRFDAWYADGATEAFDFNTEITSDLNLTAKWVKQVTVTFDVDGGKPEVGSQTFDVNGTASQLPSEVTKDGYRFDGWFTEDGKEFDFDTSVTENITVTAKWVKLVTVTFDVNGGSPAVEAQTFDIGGTATAPVVTKEGYTFIGWYADNAEDVFDFETKIEADITLTAKYLRNVKVIFDYENDITYECLEKDEIGAGNYIWPEATAPANFNFAGWKLEGTDDSEVYDENETYTVTGESAEVVFVPVFSAYPVKDTQITTAEATYSIVYGTAITDEVKAAIIDTFKPVVSVKEVGEVSLAAVDLANAVIDIDTSKLVGADVGEYDVIFTYNGEVDTEEKIVYNGSSAKVKVSVTPAEAVVNVKSQNVKFGTEIVDPFTANCETINVIAGLDAHNETYLVGSVQAEVSESLYKALESMVGMYNQMYNDDVTLSNLTIQDIKNLINAFDSMASKIEDILNSSTAGDLAGMIGFDINDLKVAAGAVAIIKENADSIKKLVETLEEIQASLPVESRMDISIVKEGDLVLPQNAGVYVVASIASDSNYTNDADAGYLIIRPNGIKVDLAWAETDDNNILTLSKFSNFDLKANATVIENTLDNAKAPGSADAHVEYLFVGVDTDGSLVLNRFRANEIANAASELDMGVYAQIALVLNWDNVMFYSEPIVRPVIITPDVADVAITDVNGNKNYAQVFTYDGEPKEVTVTVDGQTSGFNGDLVVKYIGSDTTVDGWYREDAPTDAGVYTVVALYTEKAEDGTITKAGATAGIIVINPADADLSLEDNTVTYDGNTHFATIANEGFDYLTIAMDRENNIAYVNLPEDTFDHIDRIASMLPAELEEYVDSFVSKYSSVSEIDIPTLGEDLAVVLDKIADADVYSKVKAEAKELIDELITEISENEDIKNAVAKLKAELAGLKDEIVAELEENLDKEIVDYIKDVIDVNGTDVDVDVDKVKADIKAIIDQVKDELPEEVVNKLYAMVDELVAAIKDSDELAQIKAKLAEVKELIDKVSALDAKDLVKYAAGAVYGAVSNDQIKALVSDIWAKIEAQGYVDYLVNMAENITSIYGGDIDVSEVKTTVNNLINKVQSKIESGNFELNDIANAETYIDDVLRAIANVLRQLPDGTIVIGSNPSVCGEYDCYAINISANYKAEFLTATLTIEHDYEESITDSTCTEEGVKEYTCKGCGDYYTEAISSDGHTEGEPVIENKKEATCTSDGSYDTVVYCSVCNAELSRETTVIPATGHEIKVLSGYAPTCLSVGYTDGEICAKCNTVLIPQTVLPKLPHVRGMAIVENVVLATPEHPGSYDFAYYCTYCHTEILRESFVRPYIGESSTETPVVPPVVVPEDTHEHKEKTVEGFAPTCTKEGLTDAIICGECGDYIEKAEVIPATGHTYGKFEVQNMVDATATTDGSYDLVAYCSVCGEEIIRKTVIIPAIGGIENPNTADD